MFITRVISLATIFLAAFTYVRAIPIQVHDETMGFDGDVYAQPELIEALGRPYRSLKWLPENRRLEDHDPIVTVFRKRHLDPIGGGHLLR